jgi:hypothetical protein
VGCKAAFSADAGRVAGRAASKGRLPPKLAAPPGATQIAGQLRQGDIEAVPFFIQTRGPDAEMGRPIKPPHR